MGDDTMGMGMGDGGGGMGRMILAQASPATATVGTGTTSGIGVVEVVADPMTVSDAQGAIGSVVTPHFPASAAWSGSPSPWCKSWAWFGIRVIGGGAVVGVVVWDAVRGGRR